MLLAFECSLKFKLNQQTRVRGDTYAKHQYHTKMR